MNGFAFERDVQGSVQAASVPPVTSRFLHVVTTYDGGTLRLYVDGVSVATAGDSRAQAAINQPYYLGCQIAGRNVLDDVAIYPSALSDARVAAHYAATRTP